MVFAPARSGAVEDDEFIGPLEVTAVEEEDWLKTFFPEGYQYRESDLRKRVTVGANVKTALKKSKSIKEETLRNAVFTDLRNNHGIRFPESSNVSHIERRFRGAVKANSRYKETSLAELLNEFYRTITSAAEPAADEGIAANEKKTEGMIFVGERILHGLNVTTTSLPDMTVLRGEGGSVCFGEFKNGARYTRSTP